MTDLTTLLQSLPPQQRKLQGGLLLEKSKEEALSEEWEEGELLRVK